jgi:hypothetical protein
VDQDLWPVTIVRARYRGVYEPGAWLAFPNHPDRLPGGWDAGDVECASFWAERRDDIGGGESPQEAYDDLKRRLGVRRDRLRSPED